MIKKALRLQRNEIEYLLKKGEELSSKLFIIKFSVAKTPFSQYCVIVSKKISNKATIRNKIRRRIYEAIRQKKRDPQKNIILIAKKQINTVDYQEIDADIKKITEKLATWNN